MKKSSFILWLTCLALEIGLAPVFSAFYFTLLLLPTIYIAINEDIYISLILALSAGLIVDFSGMNGSIFNTLFLTLSVLIIFFLKKKFLEFKGFLITFLIFFVGYIFHFLLIWGTYSHFSSVANNIYSALITAIIGSVCFAFICELIRNLKFKNV